MDHIPPEILEIVFNYVTNECSDFIIVLRSVCEKWTQDISMMPPPKKRRKIDINNLLIHPTSITFCELAKEWGANDFDGMLWGGARGGHREMCELAKEWGANDFNRMLLNGARGGHREMC